MTILIALICVILLICLVFIFCNVAYNNAAYNNAAYNNVARINYFVQSPNLSFGKNVEIKYIQIGNQTRRYLKINFDNKQYDNKILLGFPGGGEDMITFLNYTNFNKINSKVLIFEGQLSGNKYSFQNSFPWIFTMNAQNDIYFADKIIGGIMGNNINKYNLYLTGKSDGAGFAVLYANTSLYKNNIKGIGICSATHFGIGNMNNIQLYNMQQNYINNGIIIPYNIILPPNIPIFIMHGTGDQIMPYNGQNYTNNSALKLAQQKKTIWPNIDNTLKNTYTPNIQSYVNKIIGLNNKYMYNTKEYSFQISSNLNFITIFNQNHCWSGHINSGPNSNEPSNLHLDATYLLSLFFGLDLGNYTPTINTIPYGLNIAFT